MANRRSFNLPNIKIPNKHLFEFNKRPSMQLPRLPLSPKAHSKHNNNGSCNVVEEYDILYENQRGFYILGIPKYSANLLNPMDPPGWCDRNCKGIPVDIYTYPLPDPTWEWVDDKWMIDMSGDVDPHGWQYAFHFKNHTWRGETKAFHNFVRRRRWIRLRRKKQEHIYIMGSPVCSPISSPCLQPTTPSTLRSDQSSETSSLGPINGFDDGSKLIQELANSRLDRERILLIQENLSKRTGPLDKEEIEEILKYLDYDSSRRKVLKIIEGLKDVPKDSLSKIRRQSMPFFSDLKMLSD
ncbi:hypothetical protein K502DRAFT_365198 [Neoconidiobolus thromboides FSU 785]|nr:hypothetical protein K502DRAFT_365198 [Neoconidiobolus thromboides FSU 785]